MSTIKFRLKGTSPFMMHNGRLADPMNEFSEEIKKITSKKTKTREDREAIFRIEWEGSLYHDDKDGNKIGPYVPGQNIESMVNDGARKFKKGKDVDCAVRCFETKCPLIYKGKRGIEEMYADPAKYVDIRSIVNPSTGARSMRCRPIFYEWALEFTLSFRDDIIDKAEIIKFIRAAEILGLGEHRPKFGQFEIESIDGKALDKESAAA